MTNLAVRGTERRKYSVFACLVRYTSLKVVYLYIPSHWSSQSLSCKPSLSDVGLLRSSKLAGSLGVGDSILPGRHPVTVHLSVAIAGAPLVDQEGILVTHEDLIYYAVTWRRCRHFQLAATAVYRVGRGNLTC